VSGKPLMRANAMRGVQAYWKNVSTKLRWDSDADLLSDIPSGPR
jgi:hypothetical protein